MGSAEKAVGSARMHRRREREREREREKVRERQRPRDAARSRLKARTARTVHRGGAGGRAASTTAQQKNDRPVTRWLPGRVRRKNCLALGWHMPPECQCTGSASLFALCHADASVPLRAYRVARACACSRTVAAAARQRVGRSAPVARTDSRVDLLVVVEFDDARGRITSTPARGVGVTQCKRALLDLVAGLSSWPRIASCSAALGHPVARRRRREHERVLGAAAARRHAAVRRAAARRARRVASLQGQSALALLLTVLLLRAPHRRASSLRSRGLLSPRPAVLQLAAALIMLAGLPLGERARSSSRRRRSPCAYSLRRQRRGAPVESGRRVDNCRAV